MWDINIDLKDNTQPRGKSSVYLKADVPLNPYHISYPITWKGFFNNQELVIVQHSDSSSSIKDFEFKHNSIDSYLFESEIVKAIDNHLRRALD